MTSIFVKNQSIIWLLINISYDILESKDVISSMLESKNIDFTNYIYLEYLEYLLFSNNKYTSTKYVEKARKRLKANGNYEIVIDNMILRIIENI